MSELVTIQEALQSTGTSATFLNAVIRMKYGDEAYLWEPVTIYLEVQADFGVELSDVAMDRISAMQVVMTSGDFFGALDVFIPICNTLASGAPAFSAFDPATVEECAWAVFEIALNRDILPVAAPIRGYLEKILEADGYNDSTYPSSLKTLLTDPTPTRKEVVQAVRGSTHNHDVVEAYLDARLRDIVSEFNSVPSMSKIDDFLLRG